MMVFVQASGVPHCSNLGPLLFLMLFINDLLGTVKLKLLFVDDSRRLSFMAVECR